MEEPLEKPSLATLLPSGALGSHRFQLETGVERTNSLDSGSVRSLPQPHPHPRYSLQHTNQDTNVTLYRNGDWRFDPMTFREPRPVSPLSRVRTFRAKQATYLWPQQHPFADIETFNAEGLHTDHDGPPIGAQQGKISLHRAILDAYEFHGLNLLLWMVVFFVVAILALYSQWGGLYSNKAAYMSSVSESMKSVICGPGLANFQGQQPLLLGGVDSTAFAVDFIYGYLYCALSQSAYANYSAIAGFSSGTNNTNSSWLAAPDNSGSLPNFTEWSTATTATRGVWIGEFGDIKYARIMAKVVPGRRMFTTEMQECRSRQSDFDDLAVWDRECNAASQYGGAGASLSPRWQRISSGAHNTEYSTDIINSTVLYNPDSIYSERGVTLKYLSVNASLHRFCAARALLEMMLSPFEQVPGCSKDPDNNLDGDPQLIQLGVTGDREFLAKYATKLRLQFVATNRKGGDSERYPAYFTLTFEYDQHFQQKIVAQIASAAILTNWDTTSFVWLIIFAILNLSYALDGAHSIWLCTIQHKSAASFMKYLWNDLELLSQLCNWIWIAWYWVIFTAPKPQWPPENSETMDKWESLADSYTVYLYFGVFVLFLMGLRVCRFMRIHLGMRALYFVFIDVFNHMIDFLVFALYIMVVLAVLTFGSFQISGGNPLFIDPLDGLSTIARLMFNYLDYDEYYNYAVGLTVTVTWTRSALFWLSVVCLSVFVTNMIIAIFNDAYARAQRRVLRVEHSFIKLVIYRFVFWFMYYFWLLPRAVIGGQRQAAFWPMVSTGEEGEVPPTLWGRAVRRTHKWYRVLCEQRFAVYLLLIGQYDDPTDPPSRHPVTLLFARWSIAKLMDMTALTAMYTDYATLKLSANTRSWDTLAGDRVQGYPEGPLLSAMISRDELDNLMQLILKRRAMLSRRMGSCNKLFGWTTNPFWGLDSLTLSRLQQAIMDVYVHVPPPRVDVDEDGVEEVVRSLANDVALYQNDQSKQANDMAMELASVKNELAEVKGQLSEMMTVMLQIAQRQDSFAR